MLGRFAVLLMVLVLALAGAPQSASADQKDARLDPLFERLRTTDNPAEAQLVEALIWQIWTESGDAAVDSLMELGLGAMQSGNLPGALELFDAVTAQKPDFAEGWNKRATVLYMLGAYVKSKEDVTRVLALEPRHFGALSGLGLIELELNRPDEALTAFEQALKLHPHLAGAKARVEALKRQKRDGAI